MALYIPLRKVLDNSDVVEYVYFVEVYIQDKHRPKRNRIHCTKFGRLRVHKENGSIELILPMINDKKDFVFTKVARVVHKHWQESQFPDKTCYAA